MSAMTGGDPIRAVADRMREHIQKIESTSIRATRTTAKQRTMAAARRRGGKATAVIRRGR